MAFATTQITLLLYIIKPFNIYNLCLSNNLKRLRCLKQCYQNNIDSLVVILQWLQILTLYNKNLNQDTIDVSYSIPEQIKLNTKLIGVYYG